MKIITTPMCKDILIIAGLKEFDVVKPDKIADADLAIVLSETKSKIPTLPIKLNTYTQIYESIISIHKRFNTRPDYSVINKITELINDNLGKKSYRKNINVKVYSNFLKETVTDMGFNVTSENYNYIICPDYLEDNVTDKAKLISVPSHKNVSTDIIERITERYNLLERELCMKQ